MKTTSNGRWPQNIKSGISQQPLIEPFSNFNLKFRGPNWKKKLLEMKTISNRRRPQIKSGISQQPLIGPFSNLNIS